MAILIAGMHRSGTSALARTLNLLGCGLPRTLEPANRYNETGYWESQAVMRLNNSILTSAGSAWHDWEPFNPGLRQEVVIAQKRALQPTRGGLRVEHVAQPKQLPDGRIHALACLERRGDYNSHGADNELTAIARALDMYASDPECLLVEIDRKKEAKRSNRADARLFRVRFAGGFDGLAPLERLVALAADYKVDARLLGGAPGQPGAGAADRGLHAG